MVTLDANPTKFKYPFKCNFGNLLTSNEYDFYVCGMFQDARADALWRVGKGATPTLYTGPPISLTSTQGISEALFRPNLKSFKTSIITLFYRDICLLRGDWFVSWTNCSINSATN